MQTPGRFFRLDAVRGVAILWVVVFHIGGVCCDWHFPDASSGLSLVSQGLVKLCKMGALGVPMFFVLSGFLIHYTFSRSADPTVGNFWLRRFGRIYPPYLAALLIYAAVYGSFWTHRGRMDLLTHLCLVHTFGDRTFFGMNASFWSLAHEAQFYLLYPLLLNVRRALGMQPLVWGSLAVRLALDGLMPASQFADDPALWLMLPKLYFEWILGMYVADCLVRGRRAFACPAIVGWICFALAYSCSGQGLLDILTVPAFSLATAVWIDRIVHFERDANRLERSLAPLGVVSYSLYLWHQPIVNELCTRMMHSAPGAEFIGLTGLLGVSMAASGIVSLLVAVGAYHLIELPSIELVRALLKRRAPAVRLADVALNKAA
jgi:peptidoglycan/LPS O-acetylase OafA/YrhL